MGLLDKNKKDGAAPGLRGSLGMGQRASVLGREDVPPPAVAEPSQTKAAEAAPVEDNTPEPGSETISKALAEAIPEYFAFCSSTIGKIPESAKWGREEIRKKIDELVMELYERKTLAVGTATILSARDKERLKASVLSEMVGFGPIDSLLADDRVSEVMVNGPDMVYYERKGRLHLSEVRFRDDSHVMTVVNKIIAPIGRRVDESSPIVDARLPDGSRVHAIIPPVCLNGPTITIRKFGKGKMTGEDLIRYGAITEPMLRFIELAVLGKLNILVSGGTGTGKTTFLNLCSGYIPAHERIITIEDAAELRLQQDHVVKLEARAANMEGKGAIDIRDLVKASLRMRPDRIVIGECRSGEALDMLQAMNTGHDGSMTTLHSNSPRDAISRLETLCLMSGIDLPQRAIRDQVSKAVHLIVQLSRLNDGSRKVTAITEVQGMAGENVTLQDIFEYRFEGLSADKKVIGRHTGLGLIPKCVQRINNEGFDVPVDMFMENVGDA